MTTRLRNQAQTAGFTLLEVLLGLTILLMALAALGELMRIGITSASRARDLTQAQLLAESKLSELVAGLEPLTTVSDAPLMSPDGSTNQEWVYSITADPLEQAGLLAVQVTVRRANAAYGKDVEFTVARWMRDPAVVQQQEAAAAEQQAALEAAASSNAASSTSSGATGSGTGAASGGGGGTGGGGQGGGGGGGSR